MSDKNLKPLKMHLLVEERRRFDYMESRTSMISTVPQRRSTRPFFMKLGRKGGKSNLLKKQNHVIDRGPRDPELGRFMPNT